MVIAADFSGHAGERNREKDSCRRCKERVGMTEGVMDSDDLLW